MKQFTAVAMFDTMDQALEVGRVLRAEGYSTWILSVIDPYSRTVWMDVWCPCDAENYNDPRFGEAWKAVNAIIEPLGGFTDEAGLVGEGELPREEAYPYRYDYSRHRWVLPDRQYRH